MGNDTKERILEAALKIFARDGYVGANIKDIAESVGVVKSAFYRHFKSKEEIWNAVFEYMQSYYEERFGSVEKMTQIPKNTEELHEMTMKMVNFTIFDEKVVLVRKIITTEQFRDENMKKLATGYFIKDTKEIFGKIFEQMMKDGTIKENDVEFLAFSYSAPIASLVHLCDREPEKIPGAIEKIDRFVRKFIEIYGVTT